MEFTEAVEQYAIAYSNYNRALSDAMADMNDDTRFDLDMTRAQLQEIIETLRGYGLNVNVGAIHKTTGFIFFIYPPDLQESGGGPFLLMVFVLTSIKTEIRVKG